jgi:Raf kinase inhibitor-like YbhB/YbcL family protein
VVHVRDALSRDTVGVRIVVLVAALAALLSACGGQKPSSSLPEPAGELKLASTAFRDGGEIPRRYSCDGPGESPPLTWSGVPRDTRELALLVEDPDAERFVHWTVLRIPPGTREIEEDSLPDDAIETDNSFGERGWGGPCPPDGDPPHRYVFAVYALRAPLDLDESASPDEVRAALARQALARGLLTGRFGRG